MRRYYQLLELSEDATPEQVEKAYKRAASKHHPDKNIGNEAEASERFKEIKEAYECLSDPERRAVYDETGDTSVKTGNPAEDLFFHLLNEVAEHVESSAEMLEKIRGVLGEMIEECQERKMQTDARVLVYQGMTVSLKFRGKGANLIEGVLINKIKKLQLERDELEQATAAAKGAFDFLKDYTASDGHFSSNRETPESLRIKTIETMMRGVFPNTTGKRRGGMPFSGV